jgi:hypothetical protein
MIPCRLVYGHNRLGAARCTLRRSRWIRRQKSLPKGRHQPTRHHLAEEWNRLVKIMFACISCRWLGNKLPAGERSRSRGFPQETGATWDTALIRRRTLTFEQKPSRSRKDTWGRKPKHKPAVDVKRIWEHKKQNKLYVAKRKELKKGRWYMIFI